jgi:hypothetical protein
MYISCTCTRINDFYHLVKSYIHRHVCICMYIYIDMYAYICPCTRNNDYFHQVKRRKGALACEHLTKTRSPVAFAMHVLSSTNYYYTLKYAVHVFSSTNYYSTLKYSL